MSSDSIVLRITRADDGAAIGALHAASWRLAYRGLLSDSYLDTLAETERIGHWQWILSQPDERRLVLLAESGADLAGFVCVLLDEEPSWGACLDNLHVRPGLTGQGLGARLFARAAAWVAAMEPGWPMHLWVLEANHGARRFYERYGGTAVERSEKSLPGGSAPPAIRYLWREPAAIVAAIHM